MWLLNHLCIDTECLPALCVQADSLVYQTEKQLKELGDKVPADVKSKVEASVSALRDASAKDDIAGIKSAIETLRTDTMAMGEAMYKVSCWCLP